MPLTRPGRNWHEVYLLVLAGITGITGLLTPGARSQAIESSFPPWGEALWYAGLLMGALIALGGILYAPGPAADLAEPPGRAELHRRLKRQVTGMLAERVAMLLLTGLCTAYVLGAVSLVGVNRTAGALGAALVGAFALANAARARQIRLSLHRIRTTAEDDGPGVAR